MTTTTPDAVATTTTDETDQLAVDTLRFLSADMIEAAGSGHPGLPMGAAPMAWALWSRHLKHDPADPQWPDRDRFVLSAGHGSALLYSLLHVFGYDLPAEELRNFRQLGSRTPGHPEHGHTPGVEATTGPLGQGVAMAVGMALAERMQAARLPEVTDHHTYAIVGDGCLMEGVSHEAASLAGHLRLGRLVVLWDDNGITIDGPAAQSCTDDQLSRFTALGWHVQQVTDGTDLDAVDRAISAAKEDARPSFIAVRTVIGHGAPGVEGTSKAHGSPLGAELLAETKRLVGWRQPPFSVPSEVVTRCRERAARGAAARLGWLEALAALRARDPGREAALQRAWARELPAEVDTVLTELPTGDTLATRQSSQAALKALADVVPELVGGSADLAGSTGTVTGADVVTRDDQSGTTINFGIREFGMAAALNGLSLHGGFRPYGSTFLVFADYLRPALRLSALMHQPVVYVLTHDSVAVGEDGPTHQPVEHVESLRTIPNLRVLRPADQAETYAAWRLALEHQDGPTALVLTRQAVPPAPSVGDTTVLTDVRERGSRTVVDADQPAVEIVASGSEVAIATEAARTLTSQGIPTRAVSVPWREQWEATRTSDGERPFTVSVEAGVTRGWRGLVDLALGVDDFGASGKGDQVLTHVGLTTEQVVDAVRTALPTE